MHFPTVGIVGAGAMGAGIGGLLARHGFKVVTPLATRSPASRERALRAGMQEVAIADLSSADLVLSVVPPAVAEQVASELASAFAGMISPLFIDANAVAPESKLRIARHMQGAGIKMVDGVIIGPPPHKGNEGPRLYVSGEYAVEAEVLRSGGLDVRRLEGSIGAASALKMCYGGFNKGLTVLTLAALLAARHSGADKALMEEFGISQKFMLERARSAIPLAYPKAHRWTAEFDEISSFVTDEPSAHLFSAMARFLQHRARAYAADEEMDELLALVELVS